MRLITMIFTDVVASSATKRDVSLGRDNHERDHAYLEKVQIHHFELVRECCNLHGGQEVSTMGDAFFLAFDDPVEAVRCAFSIQQKLVATPIDTPKGPLRLRIGIHSGFPEFFEGSWHGTDVDTTARVEAAASEKQILISSRTYELVRHMSDVKFHPRGDFALKGVDRMALWEVDWDGKGPRRTSVAPLDVARRNKRLQVGLAAALTVASAVGYSYHWYRSRPQPPQNPPVVVVPANIRPTVAVLGFKNMSSPEVEWFSDALSEMVNTELAATDELRTIGADEVATAKADLSLKNASTYTGGALNKIRAILHSDYVVAGAYVASGNNPSDSLRVDIRLQDAKSGETISSFHDEGAVAKLSDISAEVGATLRKDLNVQAPVPAKVATAKASLPSNPEALRFYSDGLQKLRSYDALGARDSLQQVLSLEPNFGLAHAALSNAWQLLGYDQNALAEAKLAVKLSENLSQPNHLSIEGRYRELIPEWDKAIKIFGDLWGVFPDDPNYALELANAQTSAGKGQDALTTLNQLAGLPQMADDPRIDLSRALAAESLSDIKMERDAAASAAEKAKRQGSRLLAAHAYWQLCASLFNMGDLQNAETACNESAQSAPFVDQITARTKNMLANIWETEGRIGEALEMRRQALETARKIGSQKDIIGALQNLADTLSAQGNTKDAKDYYEEAFRAARTIGDKLGLIKLENSLANELSTSGDFGGAETLYRESLETSREIGAKSGIAMALENLGDIQLQHGHLGDAQTNIQQAVILQQDAGLQNDRPDGLLMLGNLFLVRGNLEKARTNFEEALKLSSEQNSPALVAASRAELANLELEEGKTSKADGLARQAADEFAAEKLVDSEAGARNILARALIEEAKLPESRSELDRAQKLPSQDRAIRLSLAITNARLRAREGQEPEARKELDASLAEANKMELAGLSLEIKLALSELEAASNPRSAEPHLRELENEARAKGYLLLASETERKRKGLTQ
jgi:class 3 adenylate cyclase/tetratricopeptide (TPR) repeat protein